MYLCKFEYIIFPSIVSLRYIFSRLVGFLLFPLLLSLIAQSGRGCKGESTQEYWKLYEYMIGRACRNFLCIAASYYMADAYMHLGVPRLHSTIFVYKFFGGESVWYIGMKGSFIRLSKLVGFVIPFIRFNCSNLMSLWLYA